MQGGMGHALDDPVERFVTDVTGAIVRLARGVADVQVAALPADVTAEAVDRFRGMLLHTMEVAGLRHPSTGAPVRTTASAAEAGSRSVPVVTATPSTEPVPEAALALAPPRPLEELLAELEGLVGLAEV